MAFFDEIKKQMSGVAQSAQKAAEIARLHHQVNVKQNEFDAIFTKIGQLYYDARKSENIDTAEMDSLCARIDELAAQIADIKLKIDEIRQIRRCTQCGCAQNSESRFCASCGAKLPEVAVKKEAAEEAAEEASEAAENAPEEAPAAAPEEAQKAAEDNKAVFISWPETEKTDDAAETASEE